MKDRNEKILKSAEGAFLRYSVKRTTMNDIAREAGVSRQTLYNAFSNKEEILRALTRDFHQQAIDAARQQCDRLDCLADKLDVVFDHMILRPYDLISTSPHAQEIFEGINKIAREEIVASKSEYVSMLANLLPQKPRPDNAAYPTNEDLADFIFCAAKGAKDYTEDREELQRVLRTLKSVICSSIESA